MIENISFTMKSEQARENIRLDLAAIEALEQESGGLYTIIEQLESLDVLTIERLYACLSCEKELRSIPLVHKLSTVIEATVRILQACKVMGLLEIGEKDSTPTADIKGFRRFGLGVLGWSPDAVRTAELEDVVLAFQGRQVGTGSPSRIRQPPSRTLLDTLMQRYPDKKGEF